MTDGGPSGLCWLCSGDMYATVPTRPCVSETVAGETRGVDAGRGFGRRGAPWS